MAALLIGPARQDSATVDETTVLGAGYTYWQGYRYYFQPEHPPLSQMLIAAPLLGMNLQLSPDAQSLLRRDAGYPWAVGWYGPVRPLQQVFPQGRNTWYFFSLPEGQIFGQMFVYGSGNDSSTMLYRARLVQLLFALATGLLIFVWTWRVTNQPLPALLALALWVFNPNALAYGHLASTGDINVTCAFTAALLSFGLLLKTPRPRWAILCGVATGLALVMKFTAITLAPIYIALVALNWKRLGAKSAATLAGIVIATAWVVLLFVYAPLWQPAPPLPEAQAAALPVPGWFQSLRPLLIPRDFFKGIALALNHSKEGHDAYLFGEWSKHGWWYYYPAAFVLKNPFAFVLLTIAGAVAAAKRFRQLDALAAVPWIASAVYLLLAMTSNVNIGVRHLLPIIPLLCVGIACVGAQWKRVVPALLAWQIIVTAISYPLYLQFFSEIVGGARNGHRYLLDSNYDWGQDADRLRKFVADRGISHIYLDYFGTQYNIEYLKIPNTRVSAEQARQIKSGWLVVSASQLMRPDWQWLRESRQPVERVAHTLFVYQLP